MTVRALHVIPEGDAAGVALVHAEAAHGVQAQAVDVALFERARTPTATPLEAACRWAAFAMGRARALDATPADVVVAHGPIAATVGERIAARRGVPLVVVATDPGTATEPASWRASGARRIVVAAERDRQAAVAAGVEPERLSVLDPAHAGPDMAALLRDVTGHGTASELGLAPRQYDVGLWGDGLPGAIVDALLTRLSRVLILKGADSATWAAACARCRVVVLGAADQAEAAAEVAAAHGARPVLLRSGPRPTTQSASRWLEATPDTLFVILSRCLSEPDPTPVAPPLVAPDPAPPRIAPTPPASVRPLRLVLNHGGLVAQELAASLAPWGWELKPLLGPGRDPLPGADLLLALPYGDPRGALEAVRRARRIGVPTAFWNVEDPRYFFDPELGPLVLALAREASATFSTTPQLQDAYRAHGAEVEYLPNYGRGHFEVDAPTPEAQRAIDLLFLGTLTPSRRGFLDALRAELGPSVSLVARDDVRDPDALRALVSSARLGLAVGSLTDAATPGGPLRGEGLTERLFDYPLAGTPVLTDVRACLADLFVVGEEVFAFDDLASAAKQARALLAEPERRTQAASRARTKVLERHLGRHRLLTIVDTLVARGHLDSFAVRAAADRARTPDARAGAVRTRS